MAKKIIFLLALILLTAATNVEAAEKNNAATDLFSKNISSSYVNDEVIILDGVTLFKDDSSGDLFFAVVSLDEQILCAIPYSREIYNFYLNKNQFGSYSPLIFNMIVLDMTGQKREQLDDNLGEWQGEAHIIPVYALFNVEDGKIICEKPFFAASGLESTHYHDTIKNPTYERLIEMFLTQMPRFHRMIESKDMDLP